MMQETNSVKKISLLILEQSSVSGITMVMDIFRTAGQHMAQANRMDQGRYFDVRLVSEDGRPLAYTDWITIAPHAAVDEIDQTDLILIPSSGYRPEDLQNHSLHLTDFLRHHHEKGTDIAAICTGVFLLAGAGLLNHRVATTHWAYASLFRRLYPEVNLRPERLITEDENLFCSGGGSAGLDLSLYLIERYCGSPVAGKVARLLLLERGREVQTPYEVFRFRKKHQDEEILKVQDWIEERVSETVSIDDLAGRAGMSIRNFKRRFKIATGDSPLVYLQKLRMEAAKAALEFGNSRIEEVSQQVGYEDVGFFRKLFVRYTGVLPTDYRQRYNRWRVS